MENQPNQPPWYELIKKEREQRSWTQAEVAEKIGVGVKTVGRWESGERFPLPLYRRSLSTIYQKTLHELKLDEEPPCNKSSQGPPQIDEKELEQENHLPKITVLTLQPHQPLRVVFRISLRVPKTT